MDHGAMHAENRYNPEMPQHVRLRWNQFSVRSTLVLVVVISFPLAWLASKRHERHREQRAAIAIEKLGGHVSYNWDQNVSDVPPGRQWLRSLFGDDLFVRLTDVGLNRPDVADSDLIVLDSLPYLERLWLGGTSVGDAGLSHLTPMKRLTYLGLSETRVTDASVAVLKRLSQLRRLELQETLVTARGIAELKAALPNCKVTRYGPSDDDDRSRLPPIHDAAKAGDIETIRTELAAGVPIDLRVSAIHSRGASRNDWDETTPLTWAASRGQAAAVRLLLGAGADVNAKSSEGVTPLMAAAGAIPTLDGDALACVEALLAGGAKVEDVDHKGRTAAFYACGKGAFFDEPPAALLRPAFRLPDSFRLMRPYAMGNIGGSHYPSRRFEDLRHGDAARLNALVVAGGSMNRVDDEGDSVLTTAAYRADVSRVRLLMRAGADVHYRSSRGWSPLRAAADGGDFETFRSLIDAGADWDSGLLARAAGSEVDAAQKVKLLLDQGADPNEYGEERSPPLVASLWGNSDAAPLLLRAGANAHLLNVNHQSTMELAAEHGPAEAVRLLLEQGFDPNERSEHWHQATVLIVAAGSTREPADKVRHLVAAGANLEAKDEEGRTALVAASEVGNMEAVVLLAEAGANVNVAAGEHVMTPLLCVANRGAEVSFMCEQTGGRAARALILRGADLHARDVYGNTPRMLAEFIHHDEVLAVLDEFGG